jgi:hypothetical protein
VCVLPFRMLTVDPRIVHEIARNVAIVAGCKSDEVHVAVEADPLHGFVAVASFVGSDRTFRATDTSEAVALWSLMTLVVDEANGTHRSHSPLSTAGLRGSCRLLQLSRRELTELIRQELDERTIVEGACP